MRISHLHHFLLKMRPRFCAAIGLSGEAQLCMRLQFDIVNTLAPIKHRLSGKFLVYVIRARDEKVLRSVAYFNGWLNRANSYAARRKDGDKDSQWS